MKFKTNINSIGGSEIEVTDEEAKTIMNFLDKIVSDFVKEGGGILSDNVKF